MDSLIEKEAIEKVMSEPAWEWYKLDGETAGYWNTESRSEYLASAILQNGIDKLSNHIPELTREGTYIVEGHIERARKNLENHIGILSEPLICQKIFNLGTYKQYDSIGWIIDYETPMANTSKEKKDYALKGIDLISYNEENNELILLENKACDSKEKLLRAVLEVYTYWKFMNHQKLLSDISKSKRIKDLGLEADFSKAKVKKAVLLFEDSPAYNECYEETSPKTIELMNKLDVDFYGILEKDDEYKVFIPEK